MVYEVLKEKRVEFDVENTYLYYKSISEKLGEKFIIEYEDKLTILYTFPFFQRRCLDVHILPLKKFSYSIHFTIDDENKIVSIKALICDHQNPEKTYLK